MNDWARPLWKDRENLIGQRMWNIYCTGIGGNAATKQWFVEFELARSRATLARIEAGGNEWNEWCEASSSKLSELLNDCRSTSANIGSMQLSEDMPEYTVEFFLADLALLIDCSLKGEYKSRVIDLSGFQFPAAFKANGAKFETEVVADEASFGPGTHFTMATFGKAASFRKANFRNYASFLGCRFEDCAVFSETVFGFESSFTGCGFFSDADFSQCIFEGSAPFCGANFRGSVSFDRTHFMGLTDFGEAEFHDNVTFADAWFPDVVNVFGLDAKVIAAVESADHSKVRAVH